MRIISYLLLFISFSSITYSKDNILSYEEAQKSYRANIANTYGMKLMSDTIIDTFYSRYRKLFPFKETGYDPSQVSLIWIDSSQFANVDLEFFPPDYKECRIPGRMALSIAHSKSTTGGVGFTLMVIINSTKAQEFFSCKTTNAIYQSVSFSCISADSTKQFTSVIYNSGDC